MLYEIGRDCVCGTVAGSLARCFSYPFDTVKVRLQSDSNNAYSGILDCVRSILRNEGPSSFYRGMSAPMLGGALEISVAFASYNQGLAMVQRIREWNSPRLLEVREGKPVIPIGSTVFAGGISGAAIATVLTPIECIKCRLQVLNTTPVEQRAYHGVRGCIVKTFQTEGIRGFYTGFVSCVAREVPGNAVWFGAYNATLRFLQSGSPPLPPSIPADESPLDVDVVAQTAGWKVMVAGSLAGVGYWSAFFPADVVKTRMQTSERYAKLGFIGSLNAIGRESGLRGLYRGWGITIIRAIPANAIIFFAYEKTSETLRDRFRL